MKTLSFRTVALLLLVTNAAVAQVPTKASYFGIKAGYLRAATNLTSSRDDIRLLGVAPLNSFYAGAFYQHKLTTWLAYRLDLTYQQKGIESQLPNGDLVSRQPFHYVGLTPSIGITPLTGLGLFVGPEVNGSLGQRIKNANAAPIELGISSRLSYRYKWVGFELGYFKGLTEFTHLDLGARFGFTNQTWQAGIVVVPGLIKKESH